MGKRKSKKGKSKNLIKVVAILIAMCLVGGGVYYVNTLDKPLDEDNTEIISVTIPTGSGTETIGTILKESNVITSAAKFKLLSKMEGNDGKYKAGEYALSPSMTSREIMEIIVSGTSNTSRFTIPEGLTVKQTAERLAALNLINTEDFMSEIKSGSFDYKFMPLLPQDSENRLEGFLYPETYDVYTSASSHDIINKMLSHFDRLITDEYYSRADDLGYDMLDIITIASLIERETMVDSERPIVASVIYNRMAINMRLQIDATVQYALPEHKDRLYYKDLEVDSPYNTYQVIGLPPGPICSPSIESIRAALYPEATDYYYYVLSAAKDGSHKFSNTYAEFQKNSKAYHDTL